MPHYGPLLYSYLLKEIYGVDIKSFARKETLRGWRVAHEMAIGPLKSARTAFLSAPGNFIEAGLSEKELVRHLKAGAAVTIPIDIPREGEGGTEVELLGYPVRLNYFPFKLALSYKAPLFICIFKKNEGKG